MKAITPILNDSQNALTGRVTQSSILGHRIAMDTIFVNGEDCIIVENDAVNCFDRIIPVIAALAFLWMGLAGGHHKILPITTRECPPPHNRRQEAIMWVLFALHGHLHHRK